MLVDLGPQGWDSWRGWRFLHGQPPGPGFLICFSDLHLQHHIAIPHGREFNKSKNVPNLEEGSTGKKSHGSYFDLCIKLIHKSRFKSCDPELNETYEVICQ